MPDETSNIKPDTDVSLPIPPAAMVPILDESFIANSHVHPNNLKSLDQEAYIAITKDGLTDTYKTHRFILQSINKPLTEKFQITEVFGKGEAAMAEAPVITFFGSRTRVYNMSGVVINASYSGSPDAKYLWDDQLRLFYDEYLRATKLVEIGCIAKLVFAGNTWQGYPTSLSIVDDAMNPHLKQFNMQWIIVKDDYGMDALRREDIPSIFKSPAVYDLTNTKLKSLQEEYSKKIASVVESNNAIERADLLAKDLKMVKQSYKNFKKYNEESELSEALKEFKDTLLKKINALEKELNTLETKINNLDKTSLIQELSNKWKTTSGVFGRWQ